MPRLSEINILTSIPVVLILLFLLYENVRQDYKDRYYIQTTICHKKVQIPIITQEERLKIETVLDDYIKRRDKNISKLYKIFSELYVGAMRGVLGAAMLGGGINEMAAGAIVYGTISGFSRAYSQQHINNMDLGSLKA